MFKNGCIKLKRIPLRYELSLFFPHAGKRIRTVALKNPRTDVPRILRLTGRKVDKPLSADKMKFRSPDVPAHWPVGMFAPDNARFGISQSRKRPRTAQFNAVIFGNGCSKIIVSVGMKIYVRISTLKNQRLFLCF